jgi:acyl phosphate:glycerol-3-phosphate acyltransferase
MLIIVFLLLAFLLGAVPFSFIIGKGVKGIDLRHHGSGNLGATNVFRLLGPRWGVTCLLLDMAKGAGAVLLMTHLVRSWPPHEPTPFHITPDLFRIFAGVVAALGHTFSPWVSFHGGKGVATTGGAFLVLEPYAILVTVVAFAIVLATTHIVSLGSLVAACVLPIAVVFFEWTSAATSKTIIAFTFVSCALVVWRHRANLARLRAGTEPKLRHHKGDHAPPAPPAPPAG